MSREYFRSDTPLYEEVHYLHEECRKDGHTGNLYVQRIPFGWLYHCHSCHWQGFKPIGRTSPAETLEMLETARAGEPKKFYVPADLSADLPPAAWAWLWKYGITEEEVERYRIQFSKRLNRLILPVLGGEGEIIYWQGRNLGKVDKDHPKYLNVSSGRDVYFFVDKGTDERVVVEDILSGIKVGRVCSALALLGSHIPDSLAKQLIGCRVLIWLDPDKRVEAISYARRLHSVYGIEASPVHSERDPKEYDETEIRTYVYG